MALLQNSVLVFTASLVLVITSAGNFKVSAAAQQYEAKTELNGGCPTIDKLEEVKSKVLQDIEQNIEALSYICNGTPGWRQVVFINMNDTSYNCPPGLSLTSYSKRTCGRAHTNRGDCSSTTFSVGGSEYSRVCGRMRGYQVGSTNAFYGYLEHSQTIDGWYVEGVSLTHGAAGSREHIWSFAAGLHENIYEPRHPNLCPCDSGITSPPFVENDYFCESGANSDWPGSSAYGMLFPDDPLWDGENCLPTSTCCQLNNPPWFTKNLPNATTDDIELRLCFSNINDIDDTPLELIELYVQ